MDIKNNCILGFTAKFMEAKKIEKEAFMMLLPEPMKGHFEVIENEVKLILKECIMGAPSDKEARESNPKVRKVDIG